ELPRELVRLLGADTDILVRQRGVVNARHDRRLHVLEALETMQRRIRLDRNEPNRRIEDAEPAANAHERAAGPETGHEVRQAASGLLDDLGTGRIVMRAPVRIV